VVVTTKLFQFVLFFLDLLTCRLGLQHWRIGAIGIANILGANGGVSGFTSTSQKAVAAD
jgi:hypothetical protein